MNYWVMGLVVGFGVMSDVSAQDKGGWGRKHKPQQQQQQRLQAPKPKKKKVLRHEPAKLKFYEMLDQGGALVEDISKRCSDPVRKVSVFSRQGQESCFEFGYPDSLNARYKCYVFHRTKRTTHFRNWFFDQIHPDCE